MVRIKRMNESFFVKMLKDLTAIGEVIRSRQEEKQGLLNEFDSECKRFFFGKISEKALQSSVKKTNKELKRLDKDIREAIARARATSLREMALVSAQAPIHYKATISGTTTASKGNKKVKKRKAAKKRVVRKKGKKVVRKKVVKKTRKKAVKKRK